MCALVVPDQFGEILMLKYIVGLVDATSPVLHLFTNNVTPTDSTVLADLTECTTPGYAPITLTSSNWTVGQSAGVTTASYTEKTFSFSTTGISYGYYVTDATPGGGGGPFLLWLERFSGAPFEVPDGGGSISITAKLTLS
jgi:hypothetical protein